MRIRTVVCVDLIGRQDPAEIRPGKGEAPGNGRCIFYRLGTDGKTAAVFIRCGKKGVCRCRIGRCEAGNGRVSVDGPQYLVDRSVFGMDKKAAGLNFNPAAIIL